MRDEFDKYIDNYRENLDDALWLSGESSLYYAQYKALKIKEWLAPILPHESYILDFGCGDGIMAHEVQSLFKDAHVYGVDPSSESIEEAQEINPDINFSVSNDTIPFDRGSFDLVYSAGVFHHIPFNEHAHFLQEIMRILKPHGLFILFELNPLNPLTVWTFRHNPIDANATMLYPWYTRTLLGKIAKPHIKYICFFPNFLKGLRRFEPYMTYIPFGALYAGILKRPLHL